MTKFKKTLAKGTLGTVAAGAMALATATPAMADDRRGGIDAGDVIAGAVIVGGIAALAGAFDGDRDRRGHWRDRNWNRGDRHWRGDRRGFRNGRFNGRSAVERCVRVAERQARRFGGYRFADVTQIRDVDRTRYGWRIKGRIQVEGARGFNRRDFDRGRFTCYFQRGDRPQIDFRGIRGLR